MIDAWKSVYGGAWRYLLACPLLFAVPVLVEFVQHVIEIGIGMYESPAGMAAAGESAARNGWGMGKALSLIAAGYWVARFLVLPDGAAAAGRFDAAALRLYLPVVLLGAGSTALTLWGAEALRLLGIGGPGIAAG